MHRRRTPSRNRIFRNPVDPSPISRISIATWGDHRNTNQSFMMNFAALGFEHAQRSPRKSYANRSGRVNRAFRLGYAMRRNSTRHESLIVSRPIGRSPTKFVTRANNIIIVLYILANSKRRTNPKTRRDRRLHRSIYVSNFIFARISIMRIISRRLTNARTHSPVFIWASGARRIYIYIYFFF